MSVLTGPGRNSEMSMMRSSNVSRPELADQLALARATRSGSSRACGCVRISPKVGSSSSGTWDRSSRSTVLAVDPGHLVDRVRHRRLHPDAEHVELEQAQLLDVVLVELAHREAQPAGLDRGAVQQRRVGQQHPARVQRDVPGQAVEPLDQVEQQVEQPRARPARWRAARAARASALRRVAGPDVRERLGDRVDLRRRQAQRGADVADGVPHPVGVHHRDAGDPVAAEAVEDRARRPRCAGRTPRRCRCRAAGPAAGRGSAPSAGRSAIGSTPEMPSR